MLSRGISFSAICIFSSSYIFLLLLPLHNIVFSSGRRERAYIRDAVSRPTTGTEHIYAMAAGFLPAIARHSLCLPATGNGEYLPLPSGTGKWQRCRLPQNTTHSSLPHREECGPSAPLPLMFLCLHTLNREIDRGN